MVNATTSRQENWGDLDFTRLSNVEAEEAILGGILLDPEAFGRIRDSLNPEAFSIEIHRIIYGAVATLHSQGKPTDLMTVTTRLHDQNCLEKIGGTNKLVQLVDRTVSAVNIDQYAALVTDKWKRRKTALGAYKLAKDATTLSLDLGLARGRFEDEINRLEIPVPRSPEDEIREAIAKNPSKTKRKAEILRLSKEYGIFPRDVQELWEAIEEEQATNRLKLEIQLYLRHTDPFQQIQERSRICSHYRLSSKNFDSLCSSVRNAERQIDSVPRMLSVKEAYGIESEALQWLIDGYLPKFTSGLFTGLPGVGKTLGAVDLAAAITLGDEFLGERCRQGKVLFISSDQPLNVTRAYFADRGIAEDNENLKIVGYNKDLAPWTAKNLDLLERWIDEFRPDLTIIDSIRETIINPLGLEEKSEQVGHWLREVDRLVLRSGALLWIHHESKSKEHSGVEKSSGTTAIPGAVSWHWRIEHADRKDPSNPNRVFTMPKARGFEPVSLNIRFDSDTGAWENLGRVGESSDEANAHRTNQDRILNLLANGKKLEGTEIKEVLGGNWDSLRRSLTRLVNRGIVSCDRSKRDPRVRIYYLPQPDCNDSVIGDTQSKVMIPSPPRHTHQVSHIFPESIANTGFENMGQIWDTDSKNMGHCPENSPKNAVPHHLSHIQNPGCASDSEKIRDTSELEGGEGVSVPRPTSVPEFTNRNNSEPNWEAIAAQGEAIEQEYLAPTPAPSPPKQPQFKVGDRVIAIATKEEAVVIAVSPDRIKIRYSEQLTGLGDEAEVKRWQIRQSQDE